MKYFGLRGRIILMVVGALVISIVAAAVMIRSLIYQNIVDQKMVSADILTASVVHDIKYDIEKRDFSTASELIISKYMTYYRVINQIQFYDENSKLLASSDRQSIVGKVADSQINLAVTKAKPSISTVQDDKHQLEIRSISPIMQGSKIIGAVVLEISINDIEEALTKINQRIAIIMLIAVILAISVLSVLLRGAVLNRIKRLMNVTQEISSGNFEVKIDDKGKDEIGALSRSFNRMTNELGEARQKIDDHNKQLKSKIEDATEEVVEALHEAERAGQAKSQFLATMSHEIRTPMNGVLGMLHLVGKTELDSKQQRLVDTASSSGKMLLGVINDILDFSKLDAGKLELESIPLELENMLEDCVSLFADSVQKKQVELICLLDSNLPVAVKGDPTRLRQVLNNLIGNAVKFTDAGEVVLFARPAEDGRILFGVKDTGIGMSESQLQNLFQAFSQADSSTTRKYGGTGLGLAISKKLVDAMGGEIKVISTHETGSEFSFEIPMEVVSDQVSVSRFSEGLSNQRILIVDDNASMRDFLGKTLESWQVKQVGLADGGADAVEQLRAAVVESKPYDIAIVDKQMPGINGLDLARIIRIDEALVNIKLMMLSNIAYNKPVSEVDACLTKPVRAADLFNSLLQLVGEERQQEVVESEQEDPALDRWFGGRKLLLVEDNEINQDVATHILGEEGFEIDICENGAEAVSAVQEYDYDAVLMDIQMPIMDGLEATRQIRALGGSFARLPIIAMTANALKGDAEKSFSAGMNGHVTKPIDPAELFQTLAKWITPGLPAPASKEVDMSAESLSVEPLPDLPGIDVADGLYRMAGDWDVYKILLFGFRDKHADAADKMEKYIQDSDWDEAARLAHTLKGSGGNIGAKSLYAIANDLERAFHAKDADAAIILLDALKADIEKVVSGLVRLDVGTKKVVDVVPVEFDGQKVHELLERFIEFLDTDYGEAERCLKHLQKLVPGSDYSETVDELVIALNSLSIDAARVIASRMYESLNGVVTGKIING